MKYDTGSRVKMSPRVQQSTLRMKFTALSSLLMNGDLIRTLAPGLVWALWVQPAPGGTIFRAFQWKIGVLIRKELKKENFDNSSSTYFFYPNLLLVWDLSVHPASSILYPHIHFPSHSLHGQGHITQGQSNTQNKPNSENLEIWKAIFPN